MSNHPPDVTLQKEKKQTSGVYSIPLNFRRMENLHIIFWLFKDLSWCLLWKPLGVAMIIPTMYFAIIILIQTRKFMSEFCHNLAVVFWIIANAYWMIIEFLHMEETPVFEGGFIMGLSGVTWKSLAVIPFSMGITVLVYYYLIWRIRNRDVSETL